MTSKTRRTRALEAGIELARFGRRAGSAGDRDGRHGDWQHDGRERDHGRANRGAGAADDYGAGDGSHPIRELEHKIACVERALDVNGPDTADVAWTC